MHNQRSINAGNSWPLLQCAKKNTASSVQKIKSYCTQKNNKKISKIIDKRA
jgi:hypothetical protein